jgi:hypothetical protein
MRRIRVPKMINKARDFIRRGYCDQCRQEDLSIVVHHPQRGRPFTICNQCSEFTWVAVGQSNIDNWLTTGRLTEWIPRPRPDNQRRPHHHGGNRENGQRSTNNSSDQRPRHEVKS